MNRQERRKAAKTSPDPLARAFALHQRGDLAGAEALLRQLPDQPDAMRLLGEVLCDRGQPAQAIALLRRVTALQPRQFAGHYSLGNACRLAGQAQDAIRAYQAALALNPGFAGAHHGIGLVLRQLEREAEAVPPLREAVRLAPGWAIAWRDLGLALAVQGDIPAAEAALARAIALHPTLGDAQRHFAAIRRDQPSAAELAALANHAADPRLPANDRIDLLFALGRLREKAGAHDEAFARFKAGNALLRAALARAGHGFDRARLTRDIGRIMAAFTPEVLAGFAGAEDSEAPVFIVGMPRAGSSLFEQIAASHSQVFGAGEQRGIGAIAARIGWAPNPAWTPAALHAEAAGYLASMRAKGGPAARIIDKMPDNIFQLGLISALFPRARMIFCAREVRDVMLSCYFQRFAQPYGFDTDLADCAFRAAELARLTAHWRQALPGRHMVLEYEALLAEPEAESRRLIAFLGLDWEPGCLNFAATPRAVRTASWAQVRRPLDAGAAGRWKRYAWVFEGIALR
jgi:tetratricopeptide (TPR) repeat protein